ncbi:ABC-F family ATP-binding cassette domain-containing protein [bacterium]|nr:ABC-F family ATP-binding cassette domain-containing protein [bacterium]
MLTINDLTLIIGSETLIESISFGVNAGEIIILAGANGSGKSTLFDAVVGKHPAHSGKIIWQKGIKFAKMDQEVPPFTGSVSSFVLRRKTELFHQIKKMENNSPDTEEYADAISEYYRLSGSSFEMLAEEYLREFNFAKDVLSRKLSEFSRGEQRIFDLISLMLEEPDLMLLDEPTNHLDISMRLFLEDFINRQAEKGKAFLLITHDRAMMDKLARRTIYIKRRRAVTVDGGYSALMEHLDSEFDAKLKLSGTIKTKIKKLETDALNKRKWAGILEKRMIGAKGAKPYLGVQFKKMMNKAHQVDSKIEKQVEKLQKEKPWIEKKINLNFPRYEVVNRDIFTLEGLSIFYSDKPVLEDVNLGMTVFERKALAGANGSGKTSLLKTILGAHEQFTGKRRFNEHAKYFFIPQDIQDFYPSGPMLGIFEELDLPETQIRTYLGCAKLDSEVIFRSKSELSYGELMRIALVKCILSRADFLFLDEPTNHLDIESLEILDELLCEFPGGFLAVSHDRHFLARNFDEVIYL